MNRGSQLDNIYAMVIIVIAVLTLVITNFVVSSATTQFQDNTQMSNETINATVGKVSESFGLIDSLVPLLFIGSGLGAAVLAYRAPSHPVYAFASVLLIVIMLVFAGWLGNMYESVVTDSVLSGSAASFGFTGFVMGNLFKLSLGMGFLVLIAGYLGVRRSQP